MSNDNKKQLEDAPESSKEKANEPILDESWKNVDLHDGKKTPEADVPSDIEPGV